MTKSGQPLQTTPPVQDVLGVRLRHTWEGGTERSHTKAAPPRVTLFLNTVPAPRTGRRTVRKFGAERQHASLTEKVRVKRDVGRVTNRACGREAPAPAFRRIMGAFSGALFTFNKSLKNIPLSVSDLHSKDRSREHMYCKNRNLSLVPLNINGLIDEIDVVPRTAIGRQAAALTAAVNCDAAPLRRSPPSGTGSGRERMGRGGVCVGPATRVAVARKGQRSPLQETANA